MTLQEKVNEHWEVFKTIEDDLDVISKYIKFDSRNYDTYSVELSKILIFVCSEVETIYKTICNEVYNTNPRNINDFKSILASNNGDLNDLESFEVKVGKGIGLVKPWFGFSSNPLSWWSSYNAIKHEYIDNLREGKLRSVIESVAALYALIVTFQLKSNTSVDGGQAMIYPTPRIFKSDKVAPSMSEMVAVMSGGGLNINSQR